MAVPADTRTTYPAITAGSIREDLSNIIYNISPEDTPFVSAIGKSTCDNTYFEWQIDALGDPAANRVVEGEDAVTIAATETTRVGNYTQISSKTVQSSGTAEAVDFAGRKSTQAYQMAKRASECKLDIEKMLLEVATAPGAGTVSTARQTGSVGHWIQSTEISTAGAVKEDDIKDTMEACWQAGANPGILMCGAPVKKKISELVQSVSPLQTTANAKSPAHVVAAVDIYVSDFGNVTMLPNRLMPLETAYFLDYEFWDIAYLRPWSTHELAKTGDSMQQQLIVEYGLRSKNELANAKITGWT